MEVMADKIDSSDFSVGDLDAGRIGVLIEFAAHLETGLSCGRGDKLDDGLIAHQRLSGGPYGGPHVGTAAAKRQKPGIAPASNLHIPFGVDRAEWRDRPTG